MKNQSGSLVIGLVVILAVFFIFLLSMSFRGCGYAGYRGYGYGPSFFYWGGPRYYPGPSVRTGSTGGPSHRGGGLHGGK